MSKLYFSEDRCEEGCYTLKSMYEWMKDEGIKKLTVYEAEMMVGESVFYCREFGEVGEVGESCGKECKAYSPRNGKNGRCRHSMNCYGPTDKSRVLINPEIQ